MGFLVYRNFNSCSLSYVAYEINHIEILKFLFIFSAIILGFFLLNFPAGKIFLGDAGAYMIGHLLVWCAVILVNHSQELSPFAILLIFFWPVADTLLAIWRRWRQKRKTYQPDRLHFHQLVMRFLEIKFFGQSQRRQLQPLFWSPLSVFRKYLELCFGMTSQFLSAL